LGPSFGSEIYLLICRWDRSCGSEWTVKRLKALYSAVKQAKGGNFSVSQRILEESSIKSSGGIPKGIYGRLFRQLLSSKRPSVLRRLFLVFRVYTCIILNKVSSSQLEKTRLSIGSPISLSNPESVGLTPQGRFDELELSRAFSSLNLPVFPEASKRFKMPSPNLRRLKSFKSYHRNVAGTDQPWSKAVGSILSSAYIPRALIPYNRCEDIRQALIEAGVEDKTPGHIAFLQEGGAKARVVAVPNAWCQWLFEPLHHYLNEIVKSLPNSAVHDQNKGGYFLKEHTRKTVWCYDLSSATDRFPLVLQKQVLHALGLSLYALALSDISRQNWIFEDSHISYATGQPMGLYGSFPLFHLTHYVLLEIISLRHGFEPHATKPFMVLGDDVSITDERVAIDYRNTMIALGVDVSDDKSIISNSISEFGGFLCVETNKGNTIFRPYKFKEKGLRNPISLIHSLGRKMRFLSPYWDNIEKIFSQTTLHRYPDLSPIITDRENAEKRITLDSYFLGSLVTRISYSLPYSLPTVTSDMWSRSFQDFLGNEEVTTSGVYAAPLRVQSGVSMTLPELTEEKKFSADLRINTDPLIRALRYAKI
jgi:hypothetical protein